MNKYGNLLHRARRKYDREGLRSALAGGLKHIANQIQDEERKKRNIIHNYSNNKYLNIGGGKFVRDDWRVLDYYTDWYDYSEIFIDYNVNLEDCMEFPIDDNEFSLVFSSHTLEYLSDDAVKNTLSEIHRILQPGGIVRLNVPDVNIFKQKYENEQKQWFINKRNRNQPDNLFSPEFHMEEYFISTFASQLTNTRDHHTNQHCVDFSDARNDYIELSEIEFYQKYSNMIKDEWQNKNPGSHRNWFNYERLSHLLSDAGFNNISQKRCQVSTVLEFTNKEFNKRPYMSIFVEATV